MPEDFGLAYEFGLKIGGFGMSWIFTDSLMPFFSENEKGAPYARQGTCMFRLQKWF